MENQKALLQRINTILYYYNPHETKYATPAKNLISYIRLAHEKKVSEIHETYKEFALQMMHHYPEIKKAKTLEEKVAILKTVIQGCLETIQP